MLHICVRIMIFLYVHHRMDIYVQYASEAIYMLQDAYIHWLVVNLICQPVFKNLLIVKFYIRSKK